MYTKHLLVCCRLILLTSIVTLLAPGRLGAIPASGEPFQFVQPNGVTITMRVRGDEWFSWHETLDGRPVVQAADGFWVYAAAGTGLGTATTRKVGIDSPKGDPWQPEPDAARKNWIASQRATATAAAAPSSGVGLVPVLLGNFSDTTPTISVNAMSNLLFSTTPGARSMSTYFSEVSYGKFTVASGPGGVRGWFQAPNTLAYYGATNGSANDIRAPQFVRDIVLAAVASGYNFAPYDQDGDGKVDVVNIVHTGLGQDNGGGPNAIWSHRFSLSNGGLNPVTVAPGLVVDDYVIQPELQRTGVGTNTTQITVGVFVHEHGHALGLPDLYDTDYSSMGVGNWSGMSFGANRGLVLGGDCPAHFDAWCKQKLGWLSPINYTLNALNVSFPYAASNAFAARLWKDGVASRQYFLVENRYRAGFDSALPSDGLLIWHVDENISGNSQEWYPISSGGAPARTNAGHFLVRLVQADNLWQLDITNKNTNLLVSLQQNQGDSGDPFPGSTVNRLFNPSSTPNSRAYNVGTTPGINTFVAVSNISDAGLVMTADLHTRSPNSGPVVDWVNIAGRVPPYTGATFSRLDAQHPVVIDALPGVSGSDLDLGQLFIGRAADGRWWDFDNHSWVTNVPGRNAPITGAARNGCRLAFLDDLPTGTNLLAGTHTFIVRVINAQAIVTEIQMPMEVVREPEVTLSLADNAVVNSLTNFTAVATEESGVGIQRVEVALYYDVEAHDTGDTIRWYWSGLSWSTTPLWLGADFPGHPTTATLYYPIGPDGTNLLTEHQYFISARAVDALGNAATNSISVFYDPGTPATIYWRYPFSGNWFTPGNWNPPRVPLATDHVVINAPGDYTVNLDGNATVASLRFGRPVGLDRQHLTVPSGITLSLTGADTNRFYGRASMLLGGTLGAGRAHFSAGAQVDWTNGLFATSARFMPGARLNLTGAANKLLGADAVILNEGVITWAGTGDFPMYGGAVITNAGVFEAAADRASWDLDWYDYKPARFVNLGTFRKTGPGDTIIRGDNYGLIFTNAGVIEIQSGRLVLQSRTEFGGGAVTGPGVVEQNAGEMFLRALTDLAPGARVRVGTAAVTGVGGFNGPGVLELTNAAVLSAALTVPVGGVLLLTPDTYVDVAGGLVSNYGFTGFDGPGTLNGRDGATFDNAGTWEVRGAGSFLDSSWYDYVAPHFYNSGTFRKSVGAGTNGFRADNYGFAFHNSGLAEVTAGALFLNGGGNHTNGVFHPAAGAALLVDTSTHTLRSGARFEVEGVARVQGGTVTHFDCTNSIAAGGVLELSSGVIGGQVRFNGPGILAWTGGVIGGTSTFAPDLTVEARGVALKQIDAFSLVRNLGTMRWLDSGNIAGRIGSVWRNESLLEFRNDQEFYDEEFYDYGGCRFENTGTLRKLAASGVSIIQPHNQGVVFTNTGVLDIQSGTLSLRSATDLGPGGSVTGAGVAAQDAGSVTLYGTNTIQTGAQLRVTASSMAGTGAFNGLGSLVWSNGAALHGAWTVLPGMLFNIVAQDAVSVHGSAILDNRGLAIWSGTGDIQGYGEAVIRNGGTFLIRNDEPFVDAYFYDYVAPRLINTGTLRKESSGGTTTFLGVNQGFQFHNAGTLEALAGTIELAGGGQHTNFISRAAGGAFIRWTAGYNEVRGTLQFDGAGRTVIAGAELAQFGAIDTLNAGATLELASGTLRGQAAFNGAGTLLWTGGVFGGTNTIAVPVDFHLTGGANKELGGDALLINETIARWEGAGDILGWGAARLRSTGTFEARNDRAFVDAHFYDYVHPTFENLGIFRKTAGTNKTTFTGGNQGFWMSNDGTLEVESGAVRFDSVYSTTPSTVTRVHLAGTTPLTQFGRVEHAGTLALSGAFEAQLANGFIPAAGQTFAVALGASRVGTFASHALPALSAGATWRTDYSSSGLTLRVRTTPECVNLTNGLAAWWPGDGGTNRLGTGDLAASNGATNASGLNGRAFALNGASYWSVPDSATFHPASLTVEGWVSFNSYGGLRTFFGKPLGNSYLNSFTVWLEGTTLRGAVAGPSGFAPILGHPFTPDLGRWYHVAFTFDDATKTETLYLDGAPVSSATGSESIAYDSRPFVVGADIENGSYAHFHDGLVDEVGLYSRALSAGEIASLYDAEALGRCSAGTSANSVLLASPSWTNGHFRLTIVAQAPAARAIVDVSTNLPSWQPVHTNAPFTGTLVFEDPAPPGLPQRFYRVRLE